MIACEGSLTSTSNAGTDRKKWERTVTVTVPPPGDPVAVVTVPAAVSLPPGAPGLGVMVEVMESVPVVETVSCAEPPPVGEEPPAGVNAVTTV